MPHGDEQGVLYLGPQLLAQLMVAALQQVAAGAQAVWQGLQLVAQAVWQGAAAVWQGAAAVWQWLTCVIWQAERRLDRRQSSSSSARVV